MLLGLNHITIAVSDLERSLTFYTELLGMKAHVRWDGGAYLSLGGVWFCLSCDNPMPGLDYSHIALDIAEQDFAAFATKLREAAVPEWQQNSSEGQSVYFLDPDGHKLEVHSGKHTVLLEAGGGSAMTDWQPVFDQIAEHATVIRYSRVGNGNSTQIKRHFTSRDYADYASELLEKLNVTAPVIYVAHSYGGSVARDFAAAYPDKINALLMLDPSSEHDVDILRAIDLEQGNKEIAEIKLDDMKNGMSNNYLDFWSKRPLPDYPQIKAMPVTVIASVKKTENPANLFFTDKGRELWGEHWHSWATAFPQGRAVLTVKSGHYVQFDEPDLVLSELKRLLSLLDIQ